jgi:hypothetical protein
MEIDPQLLVKIDVQGYEADVIRGATRTLSMARYVLTEVSFDELYSGQPLFGAVHDLLRDAGFRHAGSLDQLVSPLDGSVLQADALFVRP